MSRVNQEVLLQRAEGEFLKGDFENSLRTYGLILKDYPLLDEAKIGVYLSDLGVDSKEEAQALCDRLPEELMGYVVKGRNASPLYDFSG